MNQSTHIEIASAQTPGTRRRPKELVTNSNMTITLNQINSKFNELVSIRSKGSGREMKGLIYLDKNTNELGLPPSSRSIDLKSG